MYKIKVTAQRGKGKIRHMESAENYTTAEAVADFIEKASNGNIFCVPKAGAWLRNMST